MSTDSINKASTLPKKIPTETKDNAMYKFISEDDAMITRYITLKNMETGTVDECFDYSECAQKDFRFMEIGKQYNCKILLFGDPFPGPGGTDALCRVIHAMVPCGSDRLTEVKVGDDTYYVPYDDVADKLKDGEFHYYYSRKDIIQVDNIVHGSYL